MGIRQRCQRDRIAEVYALVEHKDGSETELFTTVLGWYDPGRTYGPPEDCYPPEGGVDEVLPVSVHRHRQDGSVVAHKAPYDSLPQEQKDALDKAIKEADWEPVEAEDAA